MKVNLLNMILELAGRAPFEGLVSDDAGAPMSAESSLHYLIMEHAKAAGGASSDLVAVEQQFRQARHPTAGRDAVLSILVQAEHPMDAYVIARRTDHLSPAEVGHLLSDLAAAGNVVAVESQGDNGLAWLYRVVKIDVGLGKARAHRFDPVHARHPKVGKAAKASSNGAILFPHAKVLGYDLTTWAVQTSAGTQEVQPGDWIIEHPVFGITVLDEQAFKKVVCATPAS